VSCVDSKKIPGQLWKAIFGIVVSKYENYRCINGENDKRNLE